MPQATSNLYATLIWLILAGLTVVTFAIGETGMSGRHVMLALLGISLLKSQMVANYFMGLRHTRLLWRGIMLGYFIIVGGLIAWAYMLAGG